MLMLNAIEQADPKCYCLLDSGVKDSMQGSEAQCTVPGGGVVSGLVIQVLRCGKEDHHTVAIEGAFSHALAWSGWAYGPKCTISIRMGEL